MVFLTKQKSVRVGGRNNQAVTLHGAVHALRDMGGITFFTLRTRSGLVQCVCTRREALDGAAEGCAVSAAGHWRAEPRAPGGRELADAAVTVLSRPAAPAPVPLSRPKLELHLDTELALRPVVLRTPRQQAVFRLQAAICRAFRDYLQAEGFTEIHTPKIVHAGAEGGANIFRLDYFGKKAFLAQSPQFYKQTMVGAFERVYEVGPVFRAEKHATPRHLNEYTSLDFEMGYIQSFTDVMEMEQGFLQNLMGLLRREYAAELDLLGVELPRADKIPAVRFDEIKAMAAEQYGYSIRDPYDLEPEEEQAIGRYVRERWGSEFVFVTHYPSKKRPFYAMDDPEDPRFTLSFDLLFRGMEVTTGGQRIHDYAAQVAKMERLGMDPAEFESYLMIHKYGMPPHGGLGIGLERLTMQLCGLDNIRRACLFPRDRTRLEP
ncbi:aspartate--tRNA(Asn) ligase [uncultured Flavonifractor sp.]|uniref:aspartate--tRNA(Asn) ligase n=1 Tax=uncultured Flavonifractor sp. TaxID=1193534 RepID=UPI002623640E|nr:aspartate--tRNA(Asn) ligase [uncultured Flavonifractor sp.]